MKACPTSAVSSRAKLAAVIVLHIPDLSMQNGRRASHNLMILAIGGTAFPFASAQFRVLANYLAPVYRGFRIRIVANGQSERVLGSQPRSYLWTGKLSYAGTMTEVTKILEQIERGDTAAAAELLPLVYGELRKLAGYRLDREKAGQTLQATALVHEAYIRLVGNAEIKWDGRSHFFAAAAEAMRRILVDHARRRHSVKHGGGFERQELSDDVAIDVGDLDQLLDLDTALNKLAAENPEMARLVELRYFAGLGVDDTAKALGVSPRTVKRNWAFARAWLGRELNGGESR